MAISQATATINGKPLTFETGKYAKQAGGAVTVRYGDTIVFAAGTVAKTTRPGIDFFPLTVDFEERLYAAVGRERCLVVVHDDLAADSSALAKLIVDETETPALVAHLEGEPRAPTCI